MLEESLSRYSEYRKWFYERSTYEETFEEHINSMKLYDLMEILENWVS